MSNDLFQWPLTFRHIDGWRLTWLLFVAGAALAGSASGIAAEILTVPPIPPEPVSVEVAGAESPRVIGVAGCLATSCHGGKSLIGGEATAWLTRDVAHRRAYDVLFNNVSVRMAKQLGIEAAHRDARCLACHSTASVATPGAHGDRFAVEYGVGCESCHGAASQWVSRHTTREWKQLAASEKSSLGFRDLKSLATRATTCVACHVGSPAAMVDHDLIAAGHPRLAFEMSAYHAMLPKHWNAAAELRADPAQETRLWAIGHLAAAKALSDISLARANRAHQRGERLVAPDLAEFDCQACHHDLREPPGDRPTLRQPLGAPRWGSWSLPTTTFILRQVPRRAPPVRPDAEASLRSLTDIWQRARLRGAPVTQLQNDAGRTSDALTQWLPIAESWRVTPLGIAQLKLYVVYEAPDGAWPETWDGYTQRYLSLAAISRTHAALIGSQPAESVRVLQRISGRLQYPAGYATPRDFSAGSVREALRELEVVLPPQ